MPTDHQSLYMDMDTDTNTDTDTEEEARRSVASSSNIRGEEDDDEKKLNKSAVGESELKDYSTDRVNVEVPTIEVRYKNLHVEAKCQVIQGKLLPDLWNAAKGTFRGLAKFVGLKVQEEKISILKDVSGIIKPSRLTLLLGPPGCGRTTFLKALSGKLDKSLKGAFLCSTAEHILKGKGLDNKIGKVTGHISYNGFTLEEFFPEMTSAYVSQCDVHYPDMTVRETLDFSVRCQGVGRAGINKEVSRRKKGIVTPEPVLDASYTEVISMKGIERSLQTDNILEIMGMENCADTMVGDAMCKGISGGQKRRLTTGEMIVGPAKVLFMDEISNGLDTSTTFQIVSRLQQLAHITEATGVISLLQPPPETYDLFDDVILMAEGNIIYHGPRSDILGFFEECGFRCPERKGVADFLQEVLSRKDQEQYWSKVHESYNYVPVDQFSKIFASYCIGQRLDEELRKPYDKSQCHLNALSFSIYALPKWELFKACMGRELILMKRNSGVYIFKTSQVLFVAVVMMTLFIRTRMGVDILHANYYFGSLFYALSVFLTNGIPELVMTVTRLPLFYKQKHLYPAWAYAIPAAIVKVPISLIESFMWTSLTYYVVGYSPEPERFLRHFLVLFLVHQMSLSLFRFLASYFQTMVASTVSGTSSIVVIMFFGGFILPQPSMPHWLRWGSWISPLTYSEIGLAINEFLAPRWNKISTANAATGQQVLASRGLNFNSYFYWISVGALLVNILLFNVVFTLALTFRNSPGEPRSVITHRACSKIHGVDRSIATKLKSSVATTPAATPITSTRCKEMCRMALAFVPLTVAFRDLNYYVDTPLEMRKQGYARNKLQLLHGITGSFRPGVLSAMMGVSGAGKTTLLDVLAGRISGGSIEGDIRIGGYLKVQETFSRISSYCEQDSIHSPHITVEESLVYSAWLRLPPTIDSHSRTKFVNEVLETMELDGTRDSLVGISGVNGISTERRKRLTIAVGLVSNPSIIFLDEPTTGLDARAAAIVMRAVKNVVETGRTVVCTIHQPSIDIFEAFDELILLKRGGKLIYSGPLGLHSSNVIDYLEGISGVPRFKDNYNPATWMLEVVSTSVEVDLNIDFAQIFRESSLCRDNEELVERLSTPLPDSFDLNFPTPFPQNSWVQFQACLWKQYYSYWRSPSHILVRIKFTIFLSIIFSILFWKRGKELNNHQNLLDMLGAMFMSMFSLGLSNCSTILPIVSTERTVLYRERFARMYSSRAYSFAQIIIEVPCAFFQALLFAAITYPTIGYYFSAYKFLWYFYVVFCTLLVFLYLGMLLVSLTPNVKVASVWTSPCYMIINLFSGFMIPGPQIPKWWIWLYYLCPTSWSSYGIFTSQYGDLEDSILAFGENKQISAFLKDYYGYDQADLRFVAVILITFPLTYAFLFAICIERLNFQRR